MLGFAVLLPQRPWEQHLHQRRRVRAPTAPAWAAAWQRLGSNTLRLHTPAARRDGKAKQ